jgi:hypothetical protein
VKEKNGPAPRLGLEKEFVRIEIVFRAGVKKDFSEAMAALSGLSFSDCQACGKQSNGLSEFYPFIGMKVAIEKGEKILAPHYGPGMMLCYPCLKQAIKIDVRRT